MSSAARKTRESGRPSPDIDELLKHVPRLTDPDVQMIEFIAENYFRARLIVRDVSLLNAPKRDSVVFAGNHSGMSFPWDGMILSHRLQEVLGDDRPFKIMVAPALLRHRVMGMYGIAGFLNSYAVEATMPNFHHLAERNVDTVVYPEGVPGIGKGFEKRYQLQKFSSSFVHVCLKHGKEFVPVYTINGEYLNPFAYRYAFLDRIAKAAGVPFLPLGFMFALVAVFPFVFYMGLPARMRYVVGPRLDVKKYARKPYELLSVDEIKDIAEKVRAEMQAEMDRNVREFGGIKYGFGELFGRARRAGWKAFLLLPFGWPVSFHRVFVWGRKSSVLEKAQSVYLCVSLLIPVLGWPLYLAGLFFGPKLRHRPGSQRDPR